MKTLFTLLLTGIIGNAVCQTSPKKEILLLGTMHAVPAIVKHSYKPLLKAARKYRPEFFLLCWAGWVSIRIDHRPYNGFIC
ncbi:MAG: hypothetical protein QM731_23455 [Chitinophagaceae bacterium]